MTSYDWLCQELDALDHVKVDAVIPAQTLQASATPLPALVHWREAARKWRAQNVEVVAEYERREAERQMNLMLRLTSERAELGEKRRTYYRDYMAKRRAESAKAQGRTVRQYRSLKDMTPEERKAHERKLDRERKGRKAGINALSLHPLFGRF
ncbi:septal ring factor EnvC (AmiA/AmiB activator) [Mesorhizobium robiniae]|uniref:Septal ring factor EnvC (AmiA/AmiB activator) n=1 Tax=Mesorhizobium robiniae TaxID=559315 RepID=A0ABV2GIS9_9HYPH